VLMHLQSKEDITDEPMSAGNRWTDYMYHDTVRTQYFGIRYSDKFK